MDLTVGSNRSGQPIANIDRPSNACTSDQPDRTGVAEQQPTLMDLFPQNLLNGLSDSGTT